MSRIQEQREQRLQELQDSAIREDETAAEYEKMADVLESHAPLGFGEGSPVSPGRAAWLTEIERLRKNAEHHQGWASKWRADREVLVAQYSRTEPSLIGTPPDAVSVKNYLRTCSR